MQDIDPNSPNYDHNASITARMQFGSVPYTMIWKHKFDPLFVLSDHMGYPWKGKNDEE